MSKRRSTAADVMSMEPRGSFRSWLLGQMARDDPIGDLARDVYADRCLGQLRTPGAIMAHIQADHFPPRASFVGIFKEALREWQA